MAQTNWWDQIMPAIESVPGKVVQAGNQFLPGMQELYNTTEGALRAMGVNNPQTQAVAQQQAQNSPTQNLLNSIPGASQVNGLMGGIKQIITPQVAAVQKGLNITPTQQTQQQEAQYKANSPLTNLMGGVNTAAGLGGFVLGGDTDTTGDVLNSGAQNISDAIDEAKTNPEAGGVTLSAFLGNDYTGTNTWSPYIRNPLADTNPDAPEIIDNPNYKAGAGGNPTAYSQDEPLYPKTQENFEQANAGGTNEPPTANPVKKPTQPALTPEQQTAFAKSGLDQYELPPSEGARRFTKQQTDMSVMANVMGVDSPDQVVQALPGALDKTWNNIETAAGKVPSVDVNQQIMPYIDSNLQELVKESRITDTEAEVYSQRAKEEILSHSDNGANANPTVKGSDLVDLRKGANSRVPKNFDQNSTSNIPFVNQAVAQGYRDAMGNLNPDINNYYQQYSSMLRIGKMANSFWHTLPPDVPPTVAQNVGKAGMGFGKKVAWGIGLPLATTAVTGAILTGIGMKQQADLDNQNKLALASNNMKPINNSSQINPANQTKNQKNQNTSSNALGSQVSASSSQIAKPQSGAKNQSIDQISHINDIPLSQANVKPNASGNYNAPAPWSIKTSNATVGMSADQVLAEQDSINKQEQDPRYNNNTAYTNQVNGLQDNLNAYKTYIAPIESAYEKTNSLNTEINTALQLAKSAVPYLGNELPGPLGQLSSVVEGIFNPKWKPLATALAKIEKDYPEAAGQLLSSPTTTSLKAALNKIAQENNMDYFNAINTAMGRSITTPAANPVQTPATPPVGGGAGNIQAVQPGMSYSGGGWGGSAPMPNLTSTPQYNVPNVLPSPTP